MTATTTLLLIAAVSGYAPEPMELHLPPAQQLDAARVAGFAVKGNAVLDDCGDRIEQMLYSQTDLNGDKIPELVVAGYSPCYGNGGSIFAILRKTPAGWQSIGGGNGTIGVLKSVHAGWHDVEIGGPGLGAMPVMRWNGKQYAQ